MRLPFATTLVFVLLCGCGQPVSTATEATAANPAVADARSVSQRSSSTGTVETSSIEALPPAIFAEDSIAIRGADPVAYFTESRYVSGRADYTYEWANATWQFSSAENLNLFVENPNQYAPQYGGFCAWAVAEGYTASVDPNVWEIVDDKLYLNYDARIQRRWQRDIPGNISRADESWPEVVN